MKKMLFFCLIAFAFQLDAQQNYFKQGYQNDVSGNTLQYHSPLPDVKTSLLVRSHSDYHSISWETEKIPEDFNQSSVSFVWMYGIDADVKTHHFDLLLNDEKVLTFSNPKDNKAEEWNYSGEKGATLTLRKTYIDKYEDPMGFATLKVPVSLVEKGRKNQIAVRGDNKGSNTWYMTFKTAVEEKIELQQDATVMKNEGMLWHTLKVNIVRLNEVNGSITIDGKRSNTIVIRPGFNRFSIPVEKSDQPKNIIVSIKLRGEEAYEQEIEMIPVKEWTVYLVQHTHTDIGYTRSQSEILPEHLRFIDYALDYCDQTDNYPDDARFRWTCEAYWPVREYLNSRPQKQIDRLVRRVKEGRIEITGMFFNYSEIVDEVGLAAQTRQLKLAKEKGIGVVTAMQNDVNGIGWALTEFFPDAGIKYISMGTHGHRALIPFDKPTAFWWESPSGKKTLTYRGEHYMFGNTLGIHTASISTFESNLMSYLKSLDEREYLFDAVTIQHSGYVTDNSPPSTFSSELVKEWNEKFEWPKLRIATAREFLEYVSQTYPDELQTIRGGWPDWWSDGTASAPLELATARTTQSDMIANQGLLAMAKLAGADIPESIAADIDHITDNLLFYDEHTYGAAESISHHLDENTLRQWGEKSSYAWEAKKQTRMLREKAMGLMQPFLRKTDVPSIVVFNTSGKSRSGLVEVYIDHQVLTPSVSFNIVDEKGELMPTQAIRSREDGTYWGIWVNDIPAFGYKSLRIEKGEENRMPEVAETQADHVFENEFYLLEIDPEKGSISRLFDKALQTELLQSGEWEMGQFIAEKLSNRTQLEQFRLEHADYKTLNQIVIAGLKKGPIWTSIYINGKLPGFVSADGVDIEVRLYHVVKKIELIYTMDKLQTTEPESVFVAFPFHLEDGKTTYEIQGGEIEPGKDQVKGSATDWSTLQNYARISNENAQVIFGSNEVPLVHLGGINTGKFDYIADVKNNHIYSWVYNNYWVTNFRASYQGELKWGYYLTSGADNSGSFAAEFGRDSRVPLLARVLPAGDKKTDLAQQSFLQVKNDNIMLVNAKPADDGNGIILQLRETEGKVTDLDLSGFVSVAEVDVMEDHLIHMRKAVVYWAWGTGFLRVVQE